MSDIALFHSVLGVRPGIIDAAERLRGAGHRVRAVDQDDGRVFDDYDEAGEFAESIGYSALMNQAADVVADRRRAPLHRRLSARRIRRSVGDADVVPRALLLHDRGRAIWTVDDRGHRTSGRLAVPWQIGGLCVLPVWRTLTVMSDGKAVEPPAGLGLQRGTVRLVAADERWAARGRGEVTVILTALTGLGCEVEHVGSTAVPGLCAKPILDLAVGLPPDPVDVADSVAHRLTGVGLIDRGRGADGGRLFVRGSKDRRTVHVHVLARSDPKWPRYHQLRDFLRSHPDRRNEYARLKKQLAARYPHDRTGYTNGKADFITDTLELAACERK